MTYSQDFLDLLRRALDIFRSANPGAAAGVVALALALAALCWWGCSCYTRLWNKAYRISTFHHAMCALAALITLVAVVLFAALRHVQTAADKSIEAWGKLVKADKSFAITTRNDAEQRLKKMGLLGPPQPGTLVLDGTDESILALSESYMSACIARFRSSLPYMGGLVNVTSQTMRDQLAADVKATFASGKHYELGDAVSKITNEVTKRSVGQLPRVVKSLRLRLVALFFLCQLIPFGLVGWAAYRDLKVYRSLGLPGRSAAASAAKSRGSVANRHRVPPRRH